MLPDSRPLPNGLVIIFEGIDGVGKTTQLNLAQEALEKAGWPVLSTRNMGGTPIGEALREVILSPLERPPLTDFYTSLAIQEPLLGLIDVARAEGKVVLMDRGPLSLAAYQIYGAGIDAALGWQHVNNGMSRLKPESVIFYDLDSKVALGRKASEKPDYFESKPPDYFQRVANGFHEAGQRYPQMTALDAKQSVEVVQEQTLAVISKLLAPKA